MANPKIKRIAICGVQVPFIFGGAELLEQSLAKQLTDRGHDVSLIRVPFKWYPRQELLSSALVWRLMDLQESNGEKIDLLICTRYPTYVVRHPRKALWLFHQHRQAYDLAGTQFSDFTEEDNGTLQAIRKIDNKFIPECQPVYTISQNVSARLKRFNGIDSAPLYPPPPFVPASSKEDRYDPFILYVGRLTTMKRPHLLIEAMQYVKSPVRCVIVGRADTQAYHSHLISMIERSDKKNRIELLGFVNTDQLQRLYTTASGVFNGPVDEDYGFVTLEALLARRPVITTSDGGGTLEFVVNRETGFIVAPNPVEIAEAMDLLVADSNLARRLGAQGSDFAKQKNITWDNVIASLLGER